MLLDLPPFIRDMITLAFVVGIIVVGYYSFFVLPRQREYKQRMKAVQELKVGTEVLTFGGLVGKITKIDRDSGLVHVEVAPNLTLRFIAASITQEFDPKAYAEAAQEHMK